MRCHPHGAAQEEGAEEDRRRGSSAKPAATLSADRPHAVCTCSKRSDGLPVRNFNSASNQSKPASPAFGGGRTLLPQPSPGGDGLAMKLLHDVRQPLQNEPALRSVRAR